MGKNLKHIILMLAILLISVSLSSCKTNESMIDKTVVKELDINRYLGTWYEIARFDHSFEKGLQGVTANYSFREDGKIKVINSGYKGSLNGEFSEAIGKAQIPNPQTEPAKLKVAFFWIFYADYFVLELDDDYQWAVIGSSSDKYLWILNRSPQMDAETYTMLLEKIKTRGYDISKLLNIIH